MTKQDIIPSRTDVLSMAQEAGFDNVNGKAYTWAGQHNVTNELERFAALIASRVAAANTMRLSAPSTGRRSEHSRVRRLLEREHSPQSGNKDGSEHS